MAKAAPLIYTRFFFFEKLSGAKVRCADAGVSPNSFSIRRDATQAHCSTISDPRYDNVADKSAYLGRQGRLDSRKIRHLPLRRKMGGRSCTFTPKECTQQRTTGEPCYQGFSLDSTAYLHQSGPHCLSLLTHTASSCLSISRFCADPRVPPPTDPPGDPRPVASTA